MSDTAHSSTDMHASLVPSVPPLKPGERLDQATFHTRYEAMSPGTRAELVGGVVFMMSPMKNRHGRIQRLISSWLYQYELNTPGVAGGDGLTIILGNRSEPLPDACLMIHPGGQTRINQEEYIEGAPELIVEISLSTETHDLSAKKADYERAGVCEYIVVALQSKAVYWFELKDGHYVSRSSSGDGIFRSVVFPGLWLDAEALLRLDGRRVHAVLREGVACEEHVRFCEQLGERPGE